MRRLAGTLLFCALYPMVLYAGLSYILHAHIDKFSLAGVGIPLALQALCCLVAWAIVRPERLRWFTRPWWWYAIIAAGLLAKALMLPAGQALFGLAFYMLGVALPEEFIYRGCLEEGAGALGPVWAWLVVGLGFGLAHAPLAVLNGNTVVSAVLNNLGFGLVGQFAYRYVRDKAGLGMAVGVHGLLDFLQT